MIPSQRHILPALAAVAAAVSVVVAGVPVDGSPGSGSTQGECGGVPPETGKVLGCHRSRGLVFYSPLEGEKNVTDRVNGFVIPAGPGKGKVEDSLSAGSRLPELGVKGKVGDAVKFNGSTYLQRWDDSIDIGSPDRDEVTFSAWIRPGEGFDRGIPVHFTGRDGRGGVHITLYRRPGEYIVFCRVKDELGREMTSREQDFSVETEIEDSVKGSSRWMQVTCSASLERLSMYLDGKLVERKDPRYGNITDELSKVTMGAQRRGLEKQYEGKSTRSGFTGGPSTSR